MSRGGGPSAKEFDIDSFEEEHDSGCKNDISYDNDVDSPLKRTYQPPAQVKFKYGNHQNNSNLYRRDPPLSNREPGLRPEVAPTRGPTTKKAGDALGDYRSNYSKENIPNYKHSFDINQHRITSARKKDLIAREGPSKGLRWKEAIMSPIYESGNSSSVERNSGNSTSNNGRGDATTKAVDMSITPESERLNRFRNYNYNLQMSTHKPHKRSDINHDDIVAELEVEDSIFNGDESANSFDIKQHLINNNENLYEGSDLRSKSHVTNSDPFLSKIHGYQYDIQFSERKPRNPIQLSPVANASLAYDLNMSSGSVLSVGQGNSSEIDELIENTHNDRNSAQQFESDNNNASNYNRSSNSNNNRDDNSRRSLLTNVEEHRNNDVSSGSNQINSEKSDPFLSKIHGYQYDIQFSERKPRNPIQLSPVANASLAYDLNMSSGSVLSVGQGNSSEIDELIENTHNDRNGAQQFESDNNNASNYNRSSNRNSNEPLNIRRNDSFDNAEVELHNHKPMDMSSLPGENNESSNHNLNDNRRDPKVNSSSHNIIYSNYNNYINRDGNSGTRSGGNHHANHQPDSSWKTSLGSPSSGGSSRSSSSGSSSSSIHDNQKSRLTSFANDPFPNFKDRSSKFNQIGNPGSNADDIPINMGNGVGLGNALQFTAAGNGALEGIDRNSNINNNNNNNNNNILTNNINNGSRNGNFSIRNALGEVLGDPSLIGSGQASITKPADILPQSPPSRASNNSMNISITHRSPVALNAASKSFVSKKPALAANLRKVPNLLKQPAAHAITSNVRATAKSEKPWLKNRGITAAAAVQVPGSGNDVEASDAISTSAPVAEIMSSLRNSLNMNRGISSNNNNDNGDVINSGSNRNSINGAPVAEIISSLRNSSNMNRDVSSNNNSNNNNNNNVINSGNNINSNNGVFGNRNSDFNTNGFGAEVRRNSYGRSNPDQSQVPSSSSISHSNSNLSRKAIAPPVPAAATTAAVIAIDPSGGRLGNPPSYISTTSNLHRNNPNHNDPNSAFTSAPIPIPSSTSLASNSNNPSATPVVVNNYYINHTNGSLSGDLESLVNQKKSGQQEPKTSMSNHTSHHLHSRVAGLDEEGNGSNQCITANRDKNSYSSQGSHCHSTVTAQTSSTTRGDVSAPFAHVLPPPGWRVMVSDSDRPGQCYYINLHTEEMQWELPTDPASIRVDSNHQRQKKLLIDGRSNADSARYSYCYADDDVERVSRGTLRGNLDDRGAAVDLHPGAGAEMKNDIKELKNAVKELVDRATVAGTGSKTTSSASYSDNRKKVVSTTAAQTSPIRAAERGVLLTSSTAHSRISNSNSTTDLNANAAHNRDPITYTTHSIGSNDSGGGFSPPIAPPVNYSHLIAMSDRMHVPAVRVVPDASINQQRNVYYGIESRLQSSVPLVSDMFNERGNIDKYDFDGNNSRPVNLQPHAPLISTMFDKKTDNSKEFRLHGTGGDNTSNSMRFAIGKEHSLRDGFAFHGNFDEDRKSVQRGSAPVDLHNNASNSYNKSPFDISSSIDIRHPRQLTAASSLASASSLSSMSSCSSSIFSRISSDDAAYMRRLREELAQGSMDQDTYTAAIREVAERYVNVGNHRNSIANCHLPSAVRYSAPPPQHQRNHLRDKDAHQKKSPQPMSVRGDCSSDGAVSDGSLTTNVAQVQVDTGDLVDTETAVDEMLKTEFPSEIAEIEVLEMLMSAFPDLMTEAEVHRVLKATFPEQIIDDEADKMLKESFPGEMAQLALAMKANEIAAAGGSYLMPPLISATSSVDYNREAHTENSERSSDSSYSSDSEGSDEDSDKDSCDEKSVNSTSREDIEYTITPRAAVKSSRREGKLNAAKLSYHREESSRHNTKNETQKGGYIYEDTDDNLRRLFSECAINGRLPSGPVYNIGKICVFNNGEYGEQRASDSAGDKDGRSRSENSRSENSRRYKR